jgi:hypothetical protein
MHQALAVHQGQAAAQVKADQAGVAGVESPALDGELLQVLSPDQLHRKRSAVGAQVATLDRHDIRVVELRQCLPFADGVVAVQDLERHVPVQGVAGMIDGPEAAFAEVRDDLQIAPSRPRRQSRRTNPLGLHRLGLGRGLPTRAEAGDYGGKWSFGHGASALL